MDVICKDARMLRYRFYNEPSLPLSGNERHTIANPYFTFTKGCMYVPDRLGGYEAWTANQ